MSQRVVGRLTEEPGEFAFRFAVNPDFLFPDRPFDEQLSDARRLGFSLIELAWPATSLDETYRSLEKAEMEVGLVNMNAGDLYGGERGFTNHPEVRGWWRDQFVQALEVAGELRCGTINVLAGNRLQGSEAAQLDCLRENLSWALERASAAGITVVVEVLNWVITPRYLLTDFREALGLIRAFDSPFLKLQMDCYHVAVSGENILASLRQAGPHVGHVQIADFPGRHEPGTGALDFDAVFSTLFDIGYGGYIGLEYEPRSDADESLAWLPRWARA